MIAKNFIRYPEALRFQVEMFSNGYHNSPRLMRLMTVIFKQVSDVPAWVKEAAAAAKRLVKIWKKAQVCMDLRSQDKGHMVPAGFYVNPYGGQTWSGRGLVPKWLRECCSGGHHKEAFQLKETTFIPWAM